VNAAQLLERKAETSTLVSITARAIVTDSDTPRYGHKFGG
jgi:hypothetical protein